MAQNSKNKNTLKKLPFYGEEIKKCLKKITKKLVILVFSVNYNFFLKT